MLQQMLTKSTKLDQEAATQYAMVEIGRVGGGSTPGAGSLREAVCPLLFTFIRSGFRPGVRPFGISGAPMVRATFITWV